MYASMYVCCMYAYMLVSMYVCKYVYKLGKYVCMCVYVYVCVCVWMR